MPGSRHAYRHAPLERLFDHPHLLRRCPAPTALNKYDVSTRSAGLLIDMVACLTLVTWRPRPIGSGAISILAAVPRQSQLFQSWRDSMGTGSSSDGAT